MKKLIIAALVVLSSIGCSADQKRVEQIALTDATAACAAAVALGVTDATLTEVCAAETALTPFIGQVIRARHMAPEEKARKMRSFQGTDAGK